MNRDILITLDIEPDQEVLFSKLVNLVNSVSCKIADSERGKIEIDWGDGNIQYKVVNIYRVPA